MQTERQTPQVRPHRSLQQEEQERSRRILFGVIALSLFLWILSAVLGAIPCGATFGSTAPAHLQDHSLSTEIGALCPGIKIGAIYPGGPWHRALVYQFVHANLLHLLLNVWAILGLAFFWSLNVRDLIHAYIISAIFGAIYAAGWIPNIDLWSPVLHPTTLQDGTWLQMMLRPRSVVGLSSCIYAILGIKIITPAGTINRFILLCLATQALIPGIAVTTHTACFLFGATLCIITHPMIKTD